MAYTKKEEELIAKHMRLLDITREEAIQLMEDDKLIDKSKRVDMPFDLPKEVEKAVLRSLTTTKKTPPPDNPTEAKKTTKPKTTKENPTKQTIIAEIAKFLTDFDGISCDNIEILNKERQISFKCGDDTYEITLVQKRKPKS